MKIINCNTLGKSIRTRRKELGYTQTDIAEATGLSASFISNVETGKETAEIGKILFLINTLGMDMSVEIRGSKASRQR